MKKRTLQKRITPLNYKFTLSLKMFLKELHILNFKNLTLKNFELSDKINCFTGDNGVGKTNVLDAIYYLSFCKSYFNTTDTYSVTRGETFFVIEGNYQINGKEEHIFCGFEKRKKKIIKKNNKPYKKFSEHIGTLPLVIVSPSDRDLIIEGSDTRRKFIDSILSQTDTKYLKNLIEYNKIVAQRNSLLKSSQFCTTFDSDTLEVYNNQMIPYSKYIHQKRNHFIKELSAIFENTYQIVSQGKEKVPYYLSQPLEPRRYKCTPPE